MCARYDTEIGGLGMEDFLLLRDGNLLYTVPIQVELYAEWRTKPCDATEIRQRVSGKTLQAYFRAELLEATHPRFIYCHLSREDLAAGSIEGSNLWS